MSVARVWAVPGLGGMGGLRAEFAAGTQTPHPAHRKKQALPAVHPNSKPWIEATVWDHVAGLLASPERLVAQFDHVAVAAEAGTVRDRAADQQLRARLDRVARADKRLLDAYEAGAVTLAELSERRRHLADERRALERQQQERDHLRRQRVQAEAVR